MYGEQHLTHDRATVSFHADASGIVVDGDSTTFDWQSVERVSIDDPPRAEAFETKDFYKLPATVAKPIPQPYQYGEDTVWLKKPREELKKAAWSLDNAPWTIGHPDTGMVKSVDDVHGFWKNPRYIDSVDDLDADLHIPVDDEDAKTAVEETSSVSVGFYNRVARTDEYAGVVGGSDDDSIDIDGYQTEMLFDHCASVEVGRCSAEAGCGIDLDSKHSYAVGDWVQWDASGGTAHGKVDEVVRDGCTTRGKGDMEVCAEDDDPAVVVEVYDDEGGESKNEMVRHKASELRSWSGPETDAAVYVATDSEHDIDLVPPDAAAENAQMALDAREETGNPNDCGTETGWTRAEQLASGEELSPNVVSKMSQFNRHRSNSEQSEEDGNADCGWMMWKAWGGDEGVDWAMRKMDEMESSDAFKRATGTTQLSDEADQGTTSLMSEQSGSAPSGIHVADGTWFAVGPDEHPDDSTEWPDDAKFRVNNCADVEDAWNLRGSGDISIEQSTLEARIKRAAEAMDCDLPDTAEMDAADIAASAKRYSVCGSRKDVMQSGHSRGDVCDSAARSRTRWLLGSTESTTCDGGRQGADVSANGQTSHDEVCQSGHSHSDSPPANDLDDCDTTDTNDIDMDIEFDDLSTEAALAKVAAQNDGVSERLDELREAEEVAEVARDAADELDLDDVTNLTDSVAMIQETNDDLEETIDELRRPKMTEDAKAIAERTDRFGDDAEAVVEALDEDPELISDKRELVEDLTEGYQETTANTDDGSSTDGGQETETTGRYASTPW